MGDRVLDEAGTEVPSTNAALRPMCLQSYHPACRRALASFVAGAKFLDDEDRTHQDLLRRASNVEVSGLLARDELCELCVKMPFEFEAEEDAAAEEEAASEEESAASDNENNGNDDEAAAGTGS